MLARSRAAGTCARAQESPGCEIAHSDDPLGTINNSAGCTETTGTTAQGLDTSASLARQRARSERFCLYARCADPTGAFSLAYLRKWASTEPRRMSGSKVRAIRGYRYAINDNNGKRLATARLVEAPGADPPKLRFDMFKLKEGSDVKLGGSFTFATPTRLLKELLIDPQSCSLRAAFGLPRDKKYGIGPSVELYYYPTFSKLCIIGPSVDAAGKPYCCIVVRGHIPPLTDRRENVSCARAQITS